MDGTMWLKFGVVFLSLMAGNYLWQGMTEHNWSLAAERSFFQATAIGILGLCLSLNA